MTPYDVIRQFPNALIPGAANNLRKTVQYRTTIPLYVVVENGRVSVHDGYAPAYDVALTISDEHLMGLFTGKLSAMMAFMSGKLKVDGDLGFAQQFPKLFDLKPVVGG